MMQFPFIFSDELKYRFVRHLSFWIFWWLFQGVLYSFLAIEFGGKDYPRYLAISIFESALFMIVHILLSYALMYFVLPRYLLKGKYLATIVWVVLLFLATATLSATLAATVVVDLKELCFGTHGGRYTGGRSFQNFHLGIMAGLRGGITIAGIAAAIKLMKHWYVKEQRNMQLQKENAESQLQLLKAQVHPHFLFNTLNNIYSNTQDKAPVASKLVMGLSEMLRFMLYECNQPLVPLSKDLKMIGDYIYLEKIRYDDNLDVHVDLPEDTRHLGIAPLLLLPFIENCFKHGTSNMIEQPWLSLQVQLTDANRMYMKLMNGKPPVVVEQKSGNGIGIQNVRQRLALLYPGKHELVITDEPDVFIVNLWVQLEQMPTPQKKESGTFMLSYND